jgi:hypothetical protein
MAGGAPTQPSIQQVQAQTPFRPVPTNDNIGVATGPQFGPTATPNPYFYGNTPAWAQGHFAMPWWGLDPMGQRLTQEQMTYQQPQPQASAPAPERNPNQGLIDSLNARNSDPAAGYERWRRGQARQRMSRTGWLDDDTTGGRGPDLSYGNYLLSRGRR